MGRPRVKVIDDSQLTAEVKSQKSKVKTSSKKERAKVDEASRLSEAGEVSSESTSSDVHEPDQAGPATAGAELEKQAQPSERSPKSQKPGKARLASKRAKPRSKKYQEITKDLDRTKAYPLAEAVDMVKKMSYSKFNATLEAHINTLQTGIRGLVSLPYASGRTLRILAFGPSQTSKLEGVIFGTDETIEEINKGNPDLIGVDLVVTTPEWMPKLAKIAKILGPRGLMPNPKNGTITNPSADGLKKAVESFQAGKTEYKTEPKAPVIHLPLGKVNQPNEELVANIKTLLQTLGKTKVKQVRLAPTMGPSVKVDLTSL